MKKFFFVASFSFLVFSQTTASIFGKSTAEKEYQKIVALIDLLDERGSQADFFKNLERLSDKVSGYAAAYNKEASASLQKTVDRAIPVLKGMYGQRMLQKVTQESLEKVGDTLIALAYDIDFADKKAKAIFASTFTKKEKRLAYELYEKLMRKIKGIIESIVPELKKF
jgi:hypothetical protein